MTEFYLPVACDVRVYGSVTVEADSLADAIQKVNANYIAENFEPHGSKNDVDHTQPQAIWIEFIRNEADDSEVELNWHVPPGDWEKDLQTESL